MWGGHRPLFPTESPAQGGSPSLGELGLSQVFPVSLPAGSTLGTVPRDSGCSGVGGAGTHAEQALGEHWQTGFGEIVQEAGHQAQWWLGYVGPFAVWHCSWCSGHPVICRF